MRVKVLLALVSVVIVASALPANACSCYMGDPYEAFENADGAFNGEFLSRRVSPSGYSATYTFRVVEDFKGDLDELVEVASSADGASCGLGKLSQGRNYGLLLYGSNREGWSSGLCSQMRPTQLREVSQPLPPPDGEGPIELLVGGSLGPARTIALDKEGRTLAYGLGEGRVGAIDVCPGSTRFVELYYDRRKTGLVVRDTASMDIVGERELVFKGSWWWGQSISALHCSDADASEVIVASTDYDERYAQSFIWSVRDQDTSVLYAGTAQVHSFVGDRVYMRERKRGRVLSYFDLADRERVVVSRKLPRRIGLSLSPDGSKLADVTGGDFGRLKLVDVSVDPPAVQVKDLGFGIAGSIEWLDDNTMALLPGTYDNSKVLLFDLSLRRIETLPGRWYTLNNVMAADDLAYGVGWGNVYRAAFPDGPAELLRSFTSPEIFALDVLDADIHASPEPSPSPSSSGE